MYVQTQPAHGCCSSCLRDCPDLGAAEPSLSRQVDKAVVHPDKGQSSVLETNELSSYERTWGNLKCVLLSERSQSEGVHTEQFPPNVDGVLPEGLAQGDASGRGSRLSLSSGTSRCPPAPPTQAWGHPLRQNDAAMCKVSGLSCLLGACSPGLRA